MLLWCFSHCLSTADHILSDLWQVSLWVSLSFSSCCTLTSSNDVSSTVRCPRPCLFGCLFLDLVAYTQILKHSCRWVILWPLMDDRLVINIGNHCLHMLLCHDVRLDLAGYTSHSVATQQTHWTSVFSKRLQHSLSTSKVHIINRQQMHGDHNYCPRARHTKSLLLIDVQSNTCTGVAIKILSASAAHTALT